MNLSVHTDRGTSYYGVQSDGRKVIHDLALVLWETGRMARTRQLGSWSPDLPPGSYSSGTPTCPSGQGARGWPPRARTPQGVRRRHVWEPDPYGPVSPTGLGGPDPLFPPGRGPAPPRAATGAIAGPALPRARGRRPSMRRQPNNRIKCGWVGCPCPSQSMVCPTDTAVSPPIFKTARHCALCAGRRRVVTSRRRARE
jgi:hypothetical protein